MGSFPLFLSPSFRYFTLSQSLPSSLTISLFLPPSPSLTRTHMHTCTHTGVRVRWSRMTRCRLLTKKEISTPCGWINGTWDTETGFTQSSHPINCPISHNFSFVNSPDLGQTWNTVHESLISPCCAINLSDKPWIAVTPDGLTVYITFNDRGVPKFVVSFDGGQSFSSAQKMTWPGMTGREGGGGYFFAEGMGVASSGRVCTRFIFRKFDQKIIFGDTNYILFLL